MRSVVSFNESWSFHEGFGQRLLESFDGSATVSLPHTAVELPFNYFDETSYQRAFTYQKILRWMPEFEGREVSLVFDAAMLGENHGTLFRDKGFDDIFEVRLPDLRLDVHRAFLHAIERK